MPLLREHLADNLGEMLPHLFFGDLTRHVLSEFARGSLDQLQPLLNELELAFSRGNEEVAEVIAVSLLENLPQQGRGAEGVRDLLGPGLRSELKKIG